MNAETFCQHFATFAEAPNGVAKLREMILKLAVQGRLTASETEDEDASTLRNVMESTRQQLINDGLIRRGDEFEPVNTDEAPFPLPAKWKWVRIGQTMHLINGKAFKPTEWRTSGLPIVRIQNLNKSEAPFNYTDQDVDERITLKTGDFLISWSGTPGTSFGAFIWDRGPAVLNQHIFKAVLYGEAFVKPFLRLAINARLDEMIAQAHGGVGLQHITKRKLERLSLPLPPLAEQKRIVEKVDQLLGLCDELESRQAARREARSRLVGATLDRLVSPSSAAEFPKHVNRVRDQFDRLFDTPTTIPQLRKAIVNLAAHGCLVPQLPNEAPAHEALKRNRDRHRTTWEEVEFHRLKAQGRPPRSDHWKSNYPEPNDICHDGLPSIPTSWGWERIGLLGVDPFAAVQTGPFGSQLLKSEFVKSGVPVIAVGNLTGIGFTTDRLYYITAEKAAVLSRYEVQAGDVLFARSGATLGKVCVAPEFIKDWRMTGHILRARLNRDIILPELLVLFLWGASFVTEQVNDGIRGVTRPGFNTNLLERIVFPIPPLSEQKRIVNKVNELLSLCDGLESKLIQLEIASSELSSAAVHHLLNRSPTV